MSLIIYPVISVGYQDIYYKYDICRFKLIEFTTFAKIFWVFEKSFFHIDNFCNDDSQLDENWDIN